MHILDIYFRCRSCTYNLKCIFKFYFHFRYRKFYIEFNSFGEYLDIFLILFSSLTIFSRFIGSFDFSDIILAQSGGSKILKNFNIAQISIVRKGTSIRYIQMSDPKCQPIGPCNHEIELFCLGMGRHCNKDSQ